MHAPLHNKSPRLSSHKIIPLSLSFVETVELPGARAYPERLYRKGHSQNTYATELWPQPLLRLARRVRAWPRMTSFPHFCPLPSLLTQNQTERVRYAPLTKHRDAPLLLSHPSCHVPTASVAVPSKPSPLSTRNLSVPPKSTWQWSTPVADSRGRLPWLTAVLWQAPNEEPLLVLIQWVFIYFYVK